MSLNTAPGSQDRCYRMMSSEPDDLIGENIPRRGWTAGQKSCQSAASPEEMLQESYVKWLGHLVPIASWGRGSSRGMRPVHPHASVAFDRIGSHLQPDPPGLVRQSASRALRAIAIRVRPSCSSSPGPPLMRGTTNPDASLFGVTTLVPSPPGACFSVCGAGYNIVPHQDQQRDAMRYSRVGCLMVCNFTVSCRVLKTCTWPT